MNHTCQRPSPRDVVVEAIVDHDLSGVEEGHRAAERNAYESTYQAEADLILLRLTEAGYRFFGPMCEACDEESGW